MKTFLELYDELNEKPKGLYYYINKKRKEGRKMRKKGEKGAPKASDFERAAQTAKENVQEDGHTEKDKVDKAQKRELQSIKRKHDSQDDRAIKQDAINKGRSTRVENAPSLAVLKKKIKSGTKLGSTETASAKARGLIPRADGTKRKSPKYK
jgi:hypothetical protein